MATISGVINDVVLIAKDSSNAGTRETWLLNVSFGAYTASTDVADIQAVGATIGTETKDGRTRTLRAGYTHEPGEDTAGLDVFFHGPSSVVALIVSTDAFTGELGDAAATEADALASSGIHVFAAVDVS